jgi:hypothetical protein
MKKTFFGHSFITMSASVQAQLVKFGFKGGLNYANYSGSDLQFDAQQVTRLSCRNKAGGQFLYNLNYCILHKALPIKMQ